MILVGSPSDRASLRYDLIVARSSAGKDFKYFVYNYGCPVYKENALVAAICMHKNLTRQGEDYYLASSTI